MIIFEVRDLRNLLFSVENQDMTVRELRQALFALDAQNGHASIGIAMINSAPKQAQDIGPACGWQPDPILHDDVDYADRKF